LVYSCSMAMLASLSASLGSPYMVGQFALGLAGLAHLYVHNMR